MFKVSSWISFSKRKRQPASSLTADDDQSPWQSSKFSLPTKLKDVRLQESESSQLPSQDADVDDVRFFLYDPMCFKGHKIVQRWPQWVLETAASWEGTGADLRDFKGDFGTLCPTSAGHAQIDSSFKKKMRPDGDCRRQIGRAIEETVRRLKAKEASEEKARQEWNRLKTGSTLSHAQKPASTEPAMSAAFDPNKRARPFAPSTYAASTISQSSFHTAVPFPHAGTSIPKRQCLSTSHQTPSVTSSLVSQRRPPGNFDFGPNQVRPGSRAGTSISRDTFSTARTSMTSSLCDYAPSSRFSPRESDAVPLTRENLLQATCSTPLYSQRSTTSSLPRRGPSIHPYTHASSSSNSMYGTAMENFGRSSTMSGGYGKWTNGGPPNSFYRNRLASTNAPHQPGRTQSMTSSHPWQHQQSFIIPPQNLSASSVRYSSARPYIEGYQPQIPVQSPINESHSGNSSTQAFCASVPPTAYGNTGRPIAARYTSRTRPGPGHPLQSFTGPSRSAKTAVTDNDAFQKAEYIGFSFQPTDERHEVGLREVERMHGVVQRFRRDSHVPLGPDARQLNPQTGTPFPTLVETIQVTEALRGNR